MTATVYHSPLMASPRILVIEDDTALVEVLTFNLRKEGYLVSSAPDGIKGLETARREKPDLVLLDLMLPGLDGLEVCRLIRKDSNAPIIMLTARTLEADKVSGLDAGADDYIAKPFSIKELMARVRAALRRGTPGTPISDETLFVIGDLTIDYTRRQAMLLNRILTLTPREFELIAYLARNRGRVFTREQLLEQVWGWSYQGDTKTVDVHVSWLRRKIERDPEKPRYLLTVRGAGYRLAEA
jgi:two-component system OmpR family response regulator